jgi:hypothetical protein
MSHQLGLCLRVLSEELQNMRSALDENVPWTPYTEEEKEAVRLQLSRLLETSHFKNSRRYPALLRFVVEETLEGRGEFLKERLLGIRVFDRPADYDTASDPIVRVTIAEIRKRIAQYYHVEAHDSEMRIELLPGRYEPEFRPSKEVGQERRLAEDASSSTMHAFPHTGPPVSGSHPVAHHLSPQDDPSPQVNPVRQTAMPHRSWWLAGAASLAVLLTLGLAASWHWFHPSAIDELWQPVFAAHRPILMCLPAGAGDQRGFGLARPQNNAPASDGDVNATSGATTFLDHEALGENVVFSDVLATLKIADLMAVNKSEYHLRLNVMTTLDDLKQGPSVLIGGLDNQWTLRALAPLQYHFAGSDAESYWIFDSKQPLNKQWSLDLKTQYASVNHDYALIARVHNEQTGEIEVIIAGIGMSGTAAAGGFLADPHQVDELRRRVGAGFKDHDFEAVLSTDVVNGISGAPKILAVAVW